MAKEKKIDYKFVFDGVKDVTISEYYKEYTNYASYDNIRKISSYVDGLKNTSRKVVFTMRKLNIDNKKVSRLSAKVGEMTEYPHGDQSIDGVIVSLASKWAGGNNLPVLANLGAFGTRLTPEPAQSRYISSGVTKLLNLIFRPEDDSILTRLVFEGTAIEYKQFSPTIPLNIVNGSKGTSIGFSQHILPRNPRDVVKYLKFLAGHGKECDLLPYFDGWEGTITQDGPRSFTMEGKYVVKGNNVYIVELPIGYTQSSYNSLLNKLETPPVTKKQQEAKVKTYIDLCDARYDKFKYKVTLNDPKFAKNLGLTKRVSEVLFCIDENNKARQFESVQDILKAFYEAKIESVGRRKKALLEQIYNDLKIAASKFAFIEKYLNGELKLNRQTKQNIIDQLDKIDKIVRVNDKYNYLLSMEISSLTLEKYDSLKASIVELSDKYKDISNTDETTLYVNDLKELEKELIKMGY